MTKKPFLFLLVILCAFVSTSSWAVKIAAFGDSITRGYPYSTDNAYGYANNGGYIPGLQSQLNAANWGAGESVTVYNWGYPGELVTGLFEPGEGGRNRFPSPILTTSGKVPDYVLIMEGTNDIPWGIGPGAIGDRLNQIVTEVFNAGHVPMIGTLLPRFDGQVVASTLVSVNNNIKAIGVNRNIEVADLYVGNGNWTHWNSMMVDGLHPNPTGYALMANIWFAALVRYKEELERNKEELERLAAIERAKVAGAISAANYLLLLDN